MSTTLLATFGIASAALNTAGLFPYLRDVFEHKTKPERATWWVWFVLNGVATVAQFSAGARWSVLLTLFSAIEAGIIAVLSLRYGYGKFHKRDTVALAIAGVGVVFSLIMRDPLLALIAIVAVDVTGSWLTIQKSWVAPHTETLISWTFSFVGTICSLMAIGEFKLAKFLYPFYDFIACGLITLVIAYRRTKVVHSPDDF